MEGFSIFILNEPKAMQVVLLHSAQTLLFLVTKPFQYVYTTVILNHQDNLDLKMSRNQWEKFGRKNLTKMVKILKVPN